MSAIVSNITNKLFFINGIIVSKELYLEDMQSGENQ